MSTLLAIALTLGLTPSRADANAARTPQKSAEKAAANWIEAVREDRWVAALSMMTPESEDQFLVRSASFLLSPKAGEGADEVLDRHADGAAMSKRIEAMMEAGGRPSEEQFKAAAALIRDRPGLAKAIVGRMRDQGVESWISDLNNDAVETTLTVAEGPRTVMGRTFEAVATLRVEGEDMSGREQIGLRETDDGWLIDY